MTYSIKYFFKTPSWFKVLLRIYVVYLICLLVLRSLLVYYVYDGEYAFINTIVLKVFLVGLRFDAVVAAYISIFPFLFLFVNAVFKVRHNIISHILAGYYAICAALIFCIFIADIPYFKFFGNRLSEASFQWLESPKVVLNMIMGNSVNLLFLLCGCLFSVFILVFVYVSTKKMCSKNGMSITQENQPFLSNIIYFILCSIITFTGMRGQINPTSRPIRIDDAIYCQDPVLNQAGLNPVFTIGKSYRGKVNLMPETEAINEVRKILKIENPDFSISPIARLVTSESEVLKPNIIFVLMEGMSAHYMKRFGNTKNTTPFLDSLSNNSWFFTNAYSAGIHTNNGVFSTLYSFPALKRIRPMHTLPVRTYSGLPKLLKDNGYNNLFFMPCYECFDNICNFIPNNYFDRLYATVNYPKNEIIGPFGVADDFLLTYAVQDINANSNSQPFFATILTSSNHDPYILPAYYKSSFTDKSDCAVSYADWSLKKFMNLAKQQSWFDNTIFVFIADHGLNVGKSPYEIDLSYNHIPIVFYAPKLLGEPKEIRNFIGQVDVFPTLAGLLNFSYINNTLGTDVLKNNRECIYFNTDDKLACINDQFLYVYSFDGGESLYKYKTNDKTNYKNSNELILKKLRQSAFSQTQVSQMMYNRNLTKLK